MERSISSKPRIRFGPFEADFQAGELRKHGAKLKLVGQPLEILAVLLERPGEVVTREELRTKLWPTDAFGDFDHGLNAAVNKLRDALGDSAEMSAGLALFTGHLTEGYIPGARVPSALTTFNSTGMVRLFASSARDVRATIPEYVRSV